MLVTKLTKLKEKCGFTYQQIADKSGVPLSSVSRIFTGETNNPSYRHVADIVMALGGSLDAIEGIEHPQEKVPDKVLELYERELAHKNKIIKTLFYAFLAVVAMVMIVLLIDVTNGGIGFVRY